MYLAVDPVVTPAGSDRWQDNVSVTQAHPLFGLGRAGVEAFYLRAWTWSRRAEKAAQALAEAAADPFLKAKAESIAKRHSGVWRSANKLVRKGADGRQIRAIAAVRSDAGDATCPTWLEREANKRMRDMAPIFHAARKLGFKTYKAVQRGITRDAARDIREDLSRKYASTTFGFSGIDIIIVPSKTVAAVDIHILVASPSLQDKELALRGILFKFHEIITPDSFYFAPVEACTSMSCEQWIRGQLARYIDGDRQRDRATYGIFYGKASERLVLDAAKVDREHISDAAEAECRILEDKIARAINLADNAAHNGDKVVASQALRFAQAYAREIPDALAGYSVLAASFRYLAQFDLAGIEDSPCLPSTHDELNKELWAMPLPKQASMPEWTCIEHVTIHSPADIAALAQWMREDT